MTRSFKLLFCLLVVFSCSAVAHAQSFMTFYGTEQEVLNCWQLQDVNKMTFEGGNIVVNHRFGSQDYALNKVLSIKFTDEEQTPTSIKEIVGKKDLLSVIAGEQSIRINGATSGHVSIWAVSGQQLYDNRNWRGEEISISHLQRGIYIITINNSSFKFKK